MRPRQLWVTQRKTALQFEPAHPGMARPGSAIVCRILRGTNSSADANTLTASPTDRSQLDRFADGVVVIDQEMSGIAIHLYYGDPNRKFDYTLYR